ncbi:hypothetical protein BHAOGJBA_1658 [Methylobacterium hispanicum]|jgi:hypothetical protein|uniref:Uncharacterized protein n=1 Tax=Methylobacterium hispanicum TaxID=270350 RepID=A0AAV4ZI61_9HYPH|nr:hypothetical protein BHAOGJBA_1658 [Methylobacterium hispanicum]
MSATLARRVRWEAVLDRLTPPAGAWYTAKMPRA